MTVQTPPYQTETDTLASKIIERYKRQNVAQEDDPVRFAQRLGFDPDQWQADMLRSEQSVLLNCSRQVGKSTVAALKALYRALHREKQLILLLSPSLRQSSELFRKVIEFWALVDGIEAEAETKLTIEFENHSRIVSLPGKEGTIRGFSSVNYIIVDEAARVEDTNYFSVRPMLAVSGGSLDALSSPFGTRGWWFEEWRHGGKAWERIEIPATQCPRIPPAFLEAERRRMGQWWFEQEYMCKFSDAETSAFRYEDIMAALQGEKVHEWTL